MFSELQRQLNGMNGALIILLSFLAASFILFVLVLIYDHWKYDKK